MGFIFFLSSQPTIPGPILFAGQDKVVHIFLYCVLGLLLRRGSSRNRWSNLQGIIFSFLIGVGYGTVDEWHQSFVPPRSAELVEVIWDALGILAGAVLLPLAGFRAAGRK
jgi:VanZ family protein